MAINLSTLVMQGIYRRRFPNKDNLIVTRRYHKKLETLCISDGYGFLGKQLTFKKIKAVIPIYLKQEPSDLEVISIDQQEDLFLERIDWIRDRIDITNHLAYMKEKSNTAYTDKPLEAHERLKRNVKENPENLGLDLKEYYILEDVLLKNIFDEKISVADLVIHGKKRNYIVEVKTIAGIDTNFLKESIDEGFEQLRKQLKFIYLNFGAHYSGVLLVSGPAISVLAYAVYNPREDVLEYSKALF